MNPNMPQIAHRQTIADVQVTAVRQRKAQKALLLPRQLPKALNLTRTTERSLNGREAKRWTSNYAAKAQEKEQKRLTSQQLNLTKPMKKSSPNIETFPIGIVSETVAVQLESVAFFRSIDRLVTNRSKMAATADIDAIQVLQRAKNAAVNDEMSGNHNVTEGMDQVQALVRLPPVAVVTAVIPEIASQQGELQSKKSRWTTTWVTPLSGLADAISFGSNKEPLAIKRLGNGAGSLSKWRSSQSYFARSRQ